MKVLCVFGEHNYGDRSRGVGYEYANFIPALRNLGHEVIFFESLDKTRYSDFEDLNRSLLHTIDLEQPDVILFVLITYEVWLETLEVIRRGSNAALIHWATDDSWKYEQFSHFLAPLFDVHATTYSSAIDKAKQDGYGNFVLSQWAANSAKMIAPLPCGECRYRVSFVGSMYGNRKKWVDGLAQRGIHVDCFGYGWPNGPVSGEDVPRIIRESVISLNLADSGLVMSGKKVARSRQIKARVFEVPGAGGLLMTEPADGLEGYYSPGREIIVFDGIDELETSIRHFLVHPDERDAVANEGFQRTVSEHGYEARFCHLVDMAIERRAARPQSTGKIDFQAFEILAAIYRPGVILKFLGLALALPCVLIWGRKRGRRAARRMLYELSWRLFGQRTYSAAGLPGRLFYDAS